MKRGAKRVKMLPFSKISLFLPDLLPQVLRKLWPGLVQMW